MCEALCLTQSEGVGNGNDKLNKMLIQHTNHIRTGTKIRAVYLLAQAVTALLMKDAETCPKHNFLQPQYELLKQKMTH